MITLLLCVLLTGHCSSEVQWDSFLARSDLTWSWTATGPQPTPYWQGGFLGNGVYGVMVYASSANVSQGIPAGSLTLGLGRTDIFDHRLKGSKYWQGSMFCDIPKLPVGNVTLIPSGRIVSVAMRLHLWDAELTATLATTQGTITLKMFVHSQYDLLVVEKTHTDNENGVWEWIPIQGNAGGDYEGSSCKKIIPNPPFQTTKKGPLTATTQTLLAGGSYGTALECATTTTKQLCIVSTVGIGGTDPTATAISNVQQGLKTGFDSLRATHIAWWHKYYPRSFVTFDKPIIEQFYWINVYKFGAGSRSNITGPSYGAFDHTGPWWLPHNGLFNWDMNLQVTYQPLYVGNRADIGYSLTRWIEAIKPHLHDNVPPTIRRLFPNALAGGSGHTGYYGVQSPHWHHSPKHNYTVEPPTFLGDLIWVISDMWSQYKASPKEDKLLLTTIYELLDGALDFDTYWLQKGGDNLYHLPPTWSPEYLRGPGKGDTTYELALCKWGLHTIIEIEQLLGKPVTFKWKDYLDNLAPFQVSPTTGFLVAKDLPFDMPHRHYSHLFPLFPLQMLNPLDPNDAHLGAISLDNWAKYARPWEHHKTSEDPGWTGFSYAGAVSMNVILGRSKGACSNLSYPFDHLKPPYMNPFKFGTVLQPNTLYSERFDDPTGETPFGLNSGVQDMMLLNNNNNIHVFRGFGVDGTKYGFNEVAFEDLVAFGGFLVSAKWNHNVTQFIKITPTWEIQGEKICNVVCTSLTGALATQPTTIAHERKPDGVIQLRIPAGVSSVLLYKEGPIPDTNISPVQYSKNHYNIWGYPMGS